MNLTDKQLYTLRHMLGINTPHERVPHPYRNYAAVVPGDPEFVELERLGAAKQYKPLHVEATYDWYRCTDAGKLAAMESHKKIRKSKKVRRYSVFLDLCDVFPDLTFRDFLINPEFNKTRREA